MPELDQVISELVSLTVDDDDVDGMLRRVAELATAAVPSSDAAGVTLLIDGKPTTAAATDERTLGVDHAQYRVENGPCLHAYRSRTVVRVTADTAQHRYPHFADAAREHRTLSVLAAPMMLRDEPVGAINLYSSAPHGFTDVEDHLVLEFARYATAVVHNTQLFHAARRLSGQLQQAIVSRATIDQAKGALMATYALDADEAFDLLRQQSQQYNIKLHAIAQTIVDDATNGRPLQIRGTHSPTGTSSRQGSTPTSR